MNLTEAFQKMDLLESEEFDISSPTDAADLKNFIDEDEIDDSVDIVDLQAEEEEDLEDSYIGKVIIECNVCHSKFYKDPAEINIDDETGNCDMDDECPVCFSHDGYKVIGKVAPYTEVPEMEGDFKVEVDGEPVEVEYEVDEDEDEDDLDEAWDYDDCDDDEELNETILGTLGGAAIGAAKGALTGTGVIKNAVRGGMIGSGLSNELAGKGSHASNYARIGAGYGLGNKGKGFGKSLAGAAKWGAGGAATGAIAGDAVQKGLGNLKGMLTGSQGKNNTAALTAALQSNGLKDDQIQNILASLMNESYHRDLIEEFQAAAIETEDQLMSLDSDETGRITITAQPKEAVETGEEMLAPLDAEDEREITGDDTDDGLEFGEEEQEEAPEEEAPEEGQDEEDSVDVDEVDEDSFDELGESYLKKVYENVNSFHTSNIYKKGNKLVLEGVIKFNSGKNKKTTFIFEAYNRTRTGRIRFIGENKEITRGKKAFTITGKIQNRKYICESLNYNYRQKDAKGKSTRLYGTIKK